MKTPISTILIRVLFGIILLMVGASLLRDGMDALNIFTLIVSTVFLYVAEKYYKHEKTRLV
jgi:hypothetical protein